MQKAATKRVIPGTPVFDGDAAQKGYAINAMCFSFNEAKNRQAFLDDEDAYCAKFNLTPEQREAVRQRNVLAMIRNSGEEPVVIEYLKTPLLREALVDLMTRMGIGLAWQRIERVASASSSRPGMERMKSY